MASRGASWIVEAFTLFRRAPLAWIALCSGWILITLILLMVPLVGQAIANFLQPVFFASFAIVAYKQAAGEGVLMADLFAGFKRNLRALLNRADMTDQEVRTLRGVIVALAKGKYRRKPPEGA